MFNPRTISYAHEHVAQLRREAQAARLTRGATTQLARFVARTFRAWANRMDGGSQRTEQLIGNWQFERSRGEAPLAG